ncbi:hypothetical protein HOP50_15g75670 [Chloropicon primus]|uniref:THUMP domain-containing protein n=2 Tax=Chloropicon primus TaxID=1764295 RepID=A0A5B8MZY5_9CHLO|nr:hypothetical protein A3770_15p75420 [Chloropicon primus]UPR04232.1 hypothetical protein HOP50_15g75670 [Chloropicon primus]|eukprot:QDZ25024.1 hypothetical protein A3770_15p75420 [Chloropicon primus]
MSKAPAPGTKQKDRDGPSEAGRAKRSKYNPAAKTADQIRGCPGLLITSYPGKERHCAREVLSLLDECKPSSSPESIKASGTEKSISERLKSELEELRDPRKKAYRYHMMKGVNGVIFLEFTEEARGVWTPAEAAAAIADDAVRTRKCKSKWIGRMIPVETSCFASLDDIGKLAESVAEKHFPKDKGEGLTFAVEYESRSCKQFNRMDVIDKFAHAVSQPPYVVKLRGADRSILVQLITNKCFVSVVPGYKEKYCKFNLQRLVEREEEQGEDDEAKKDDE